MSERALTTSIWVGYEAERTVRGAKFGAKAQFKKSMIYALHGKGVGDEACRKEVANILLDEPSLGAWNDCSGIHFVHE